MTYFNDEFTFNKLKSHIGHHITCKPYGNEESGIVNITIACETCNEVLCDCDKPDNMDYVEFSNELPEEIAIRWNIDDVDYALEDAELDDYPPLTNQEKARILDYVERHHDANYGISWDSLRDAADILYSDRLYLVRQDD